MIIIDRAFERLADLNESICLSLCGGRIKRGLSSSPKGGDDATAGGEGRERTLSICASADEALESTSGNEPATCPIESSSDPRATSLCPSTASSSVPTEGEKKLASGLVTEEEGDNAKRDEEGPLDVIATGWGRYVAGPRRKKQLGSRRYREYLCSSVPLDRIVQSISCAIDADARAANRSFKGDGCVWRVEMSMSVKSSASETFGINIRVCDVDADDDGERDVNPIPPMGRGGQNVRLPSSLMDGKQEFNATQSNQRLVSPPPQHRGGRVGGLSLTLSAPSAQGLMAKAGDHVVVMSLLGSGKEKADVFYELSDEIISRLIRRELPLWLKAFDNAPGSRSFSGDYDLKEELNSGAQATVHRVVHKSDGQEYAVKVISRLNLTSTASGAVLYEVLLQSSLSCHPNVVSLTDFFEESDNYYLVMELMRGGDLFDRIAQREKYTELEARRLCRDLLRAVGYCHKNGVAHCDLKPKNMMLTDEGNITHIRLADFGLSSRMTAPNSLHRLCGSPYYVAPEIIKRVPYGQKADMWSTGVITYLLLGGTVPFSGSNLADIFRKVASGEFEFVPPEVWDTVTPEAKELIKGLIQPDPSMRLSAEQALKSPWFRIDDRTLARRDLTSVAKSFRSFDARMKFRGAVLMVQGAQRLVAGVGGNAKKKWNYQSNSDTCTTVEKDEEREETKTEREGKKLERPDMDNGEGDRSEFACIPVARETPGTVFEQK